MIKVVNEVKAKGSKEVRRYVVVEGLYQNYGTVCRLPEIVALCKQYKFRIILDDSNGLGSLGANGRGTLEHFGMEVSLFPLPCQRGSGLTSFLCSQAVYTLCVRISPTAWAL